MQEDTGMELDNLSKDEIRRLVHELDVHRVELEMQNESCAGPRMNWRRRSIATPTCMIMPRSVI